MPLKGSNPLVLHALDWANYGFTYEGIVDIDKAGDNWTLNDNEVNNFFGNICGGYHGEAAVLILIAPIPHNYQTADTDIAPMQQPV